MEKAIDPDGLNDAEVDAALHELQPLKEAELRAITREAGLDNVGTKKADILKKIRMKLTEATTGPGKYSGLRLPSRGEITPRGATTTMQRQARRSSNRCHQRRCKYCRRVMRRL